MTISRLANWPAIACVLFSLASCADEEEPPYAVRGIQDAGSGDASTMPIEVPGQAEQLEDLSEWGAGVHDLEKLCANLDYTCGIDKQGTPYCWSVGPTSENPVLTVPEALSNLVQIACGAVHACALDADGIITCWGAGRGDVADVPGALEAGQSIVPEGRYKEVSARGLHTCAINDVDELVCWGAGEPGRREGQQPNFGQATPPSGVYRNVSAGEAHTCAIELETSQVRCWGAESGGAGTCSPPGNYSCGQTLAPPGPFVHVSSGEQHTCALSEDGQVECWGSGSTNLRCAPYAGLFECGQADPPTHGASPFVRLFSGWAFTCGLTLEYKAKCWGWNANNMAMPPPSDFSQLTAGGNHHACGIELEGDVRCWGATEGPPAGVP